MSYSLIIGNCSNIDGASLFRQNVPMITRGGCSRRVHKIVYLAVKKGVFFTSENIHRELLSLINIAVYLLNKMFMGLVKVAIAPELCQKCDFFSLKEDDFFAYVLECMLTFDKMQNTNPLMCTTFEV